MSRPVEPCRIMLLSAHQSIVSRHIACKYVRLDLKMEFGFPKNQGGFMRILCAVDGSEYSRWGVQALGTLAGREPEQVVLLHVIKKPEPQAPKRKASSPETQALEAMAKAGDLLLQEAEHTARVALGQAATGPGTKIHRVLAYGPLASTVAKRARRWKADLIVVGSRGLSDIKGFLLGSVSRQIASMASCSVLVVKQPVSGLRRITLAVDDSKQSRAAAAFLRSTIIPESATVTILTSAESPVTDLAERYLLESQLAALTKPVMERAESLVNSLRDDFIKDGYTAITKVQMDHVIDTIVKHVEADRSDLLAVGSRTMTKTERLHLGSVSESLLRHAPCSILIVGGARA